MKNSRIGQELMFMEFNEEDGTITMLDGSAWTIPPGAIPKVICWIPTSRIRVEKNMSSNFPYKLVNLSTHGPQWVEADHLY